MGAEVPTVAVSCHMEVQLGPVWEVGSNAYASSVNMVGGPSLPHALVCAVRTELSLTARHVDSGSHKVDATLGVCSCYQTRGLPTYRRATSWRCITQTTLGSNPLGTGT